MKVKIIKKIKVNFMQAFKELFFTQTVIIFLLIKLYNTIMKLQFTQPQY